MTQVEPGGDLEKIANLRRSVSTLLLVTRSRVVQYIENSFAGRESEYISVRRSPSTELIQHSVYPREAAMRKKVFVRSTRFLLPHVFAHRSCNISRDSKYWFLFLCFFLYQQTTTPNLTLILPLFQAIFKPFHPQIRIVLALDEVEYIPHNHIHSRKK